MKKKLSKFTKRWLSKGNTFRGAEPLKLFITNHILPELGNILLNFSLCLFSALIILLMLMLFGFDFTFKNYLGTVGLYYVVYEVKDWFDTWLKGNK